MSINASPTSPSHEAMIAQIQSERAAIETKFQSLDQSSQQLDEEDRRIDTQAAAVEERIRALASEEAELQRRKKALQSEAQEIGDKRTEIITRRKRLSKERESLQTQLDEIDLRRSRIDQQRAFEESQKEASFSQHVAPAEPVAPALSPASPCKREQNRAHPRIAVAVDVSMHTEHNFYTGLTENLSEGGLFIATYEIPPLGTEIELTISLPNHPPIKAVGVVRWHREYNKFTSDLAPGIGVQFSKLTDSDHAAIEHFIREREPLLYESF